MMVKEHDLFASSRRVLTPFYVYPDFGSVRDFGIFRVGGAGLANCLLSWAKASVVAERIGAVRLSPTWPSIKIGPILRRERDWRHYIGLFSAEPDSVAGLAKLKILAMSKRVTLMHVGDPVNPEPGTIYVMDGSNVAPDYFDGLLQHRAKIVERLLAMTRPEIIERSNMSANGDVAVHVRLGDFGAPPPTGSSISGPLANLRVPINWYIDRIKALRTALGSHLRVTVFSDGRDEELRPILELPYTSRATCGNALSDMLSISYAPIVVASGSTFSMWASFIGSGVSVWAPGRLFQRVKENPDGEIESEIGADLPSSFVAAAAQALHRCRVEIL